MDSWNYQEYLDSVKQDMKYGFESREYDVEEAFGFAHEELLSRLEKFPGETPLALTALAVCLNEYEKLTMFSAEDDFVREICNAYESEYFNLATKKLDAEQSERFDKDVNLVKGVLRI